MHLRYIVDVEIDLTAVSGLPEKVVRDEIASNLESVDYVRGCYVRPSSGIETNQGSTAMEDTANTQPTESAEPRKGRVVARMPREGNVHATIFENIGANGPFLTADYQSSYVTGEGDNQKRHYTHSFKATDGADLGKQVEATTAKMRELQQAQGQSR